MDTNKLKGKIPDAVLEQLPTVMSNLNLTRLCVYHIS